MSMIGLRVPQEAAHTLSEIKVPGDPEQIANYHVTLLHLGDDLPISTVALATMVAYEVAAKTRPFSVRTSRVSCFPNAEKVPVVARIESDALHTLWVDLREAFDAVHLEYSKKFPEYKPHTTIAWAKEPIEDIRIPTMEWGAHELVIWGGDRGDRRVIVTIPFPLTDRVASRSQPAMILSRRAGMGSLVPNVMFRHLLSELGS